MQDGILRGNPAVQRRAMAKAITLLESSRADHREQADGLLTALLPHTGKAFRLGISGVPGVGKSTFIEALGLYLIEQGCGGGAGDRSVVHRLRRLHPRRQDPHGAAVHAAGGLIRPSPSSGTLGGVAEKTREAMLVCEAAGYDVVIVETVGVGQSEIAVHGMTDMFCVLQLPNAGDDLQAIKKGVMELADLVVINKADIDPMPPRVPGPDHIEPALLGMHGNPITPTPARCGSRGAADQCLAGAGGGGLLGCSQQLQDLQTANGRLALRREKQALAWMWERIDFGLKQAFRQHPQVKACSPSFRTMWPRVASPPVRQQEICF
jgi:LAO/AO transport system kinase